MTEHTDTPINSSSMSPEVQAIVNSTVAAAVKEAVSGVFANLAPLLRDMAITPEKLREANRPYEDPEKIKRELRESLKSKKDEAELRRMDAERKANCPHLDRNGRTAINLCHNHCDHQPRGVCVLCSDWIHPKEWRIAASEEQAAQLAISHSEQHLKGCAYVVAAHKNYPTVMALESMS